MATKGEGEVGLARMGPVLGDAGKVFQLKRVRFVRALRPDQVDDPVALGLEPLKTSVIEEAKNVDGGVEMDGQEEAATNAVDLYPMERVQLKWRSVRPACSGLVNPHATCFMNASLQVLFQLPPMVAWMEDLQRSSGGGGGGFTGRLLRLFSKMHLGKVEVEAEELCKPNIIGQICAGHSAGKMEDAQEWLMGLLGKLHAEAVERGTKGLKSTQGAVTPETEYTSFLYRIFGGKIRTQISCKKEDFRKNVYEHFASLEVELGKAKTIEQALASYTKGEYLHGDNKYRLEYGSGKQDFKMVDAVKRITISEAPNVLMVLLKRFPLPGMKNTRQVDFTTTLDLKPYLSEDAKDLGARRYNLIGVVVHSGHSTQTGHYFTYAKAANGIWHHFDDESVQPVSESQVLRAQAYVLMYTRQPDAQQPKNNPCASTASQSQVHDPNISNVPGKTDAVATTSTQPAKLPVPPAVGKTNAETVVQPAISAKQELPAVSKTKDETPTRTVVAPKPKAPVPSNGVAANGASPMKPKARALKVYAPTGLRKSPLGVKPIVQKRKQVIGKCESGERVRTSPSAARLRMAKGGVDNAPDGEYITSLFGGICVRKDMEYASDSSGDNEESPSGNSQQIRGRTTNGGRGSQTPNHGPARSPMANGNIAGKKRSLSKNGGVEETESPIPTKRSKIGAADQAEVDRKNKSNGSGGLTPSPFAKPNFGAQEAPKQRRHSVTSLDIGKSPVSRRLSAACRKLSMEVPIEGFGRTGSTPVNNSTPSKLVQTRSEELPRFKQKEKALDIASARQPPTQPINERIKHSGAQPRKRASDAEGPVHEPRPTMGPAEESAPQRKEEPLPNPEPEVKNFIETGEDACSWLQGRGSNGGWECGRSGTRNSVRSANKPRFLKRDRSEFDAEYNEEYDRGKTKKKKNKKIPFSSGRNDFQHKFDTRKHE
ncbi:hypothetical protein BSKO_00052 [Bryopsis sp. KO-2023]|nr:hypothetical protein BSKO_00052 [Bryopsis sp. KO-2023]